MKLRTFRRILIAALILTPIALAIDSFWIEPGRLVVRETELALPRWPRALDGLKVVLLSDLHTGSPRNGIDNLRRVVEETNAQRPDLVVLAGDYVIHGVLGGTFCEPEAIAEVLGTLRPTLGAPRVTSALTNAGIGVIDDRAAKLEWKGSTFYVAGISDYWEGRHDVGRALASVPTGAPVITLTHNPDVFHEVPERVTLTLAGHTHGGQVNLPVVG